MILLDARKDRLITLDLTTPADSTVIGDLIAGLNPISISTHGSNFYLGAAKDKNLYLINNTDPDNESGSYGAIGKLPDGTIPGCLASNGTNLFMLDTRKDRLYQVNTTTPSSSTLVGSLIAGIQPVAMAFVSTSFYVASAKDNGLYLINITDPDDESGSYGRVGTLPGKPLSLGVDSSTLYMVDNRDNLFSINLTTLSSSSNVGSLLAGTSPLDLD